MFWLSTSTIVRLRDQLRAAARKASAPSLGAEPGASTRDDEAVLESEYAPLCEAMYLMMSTDGDISTEEREVLSGALKNLSGSALDVDLIDAMLELAQKRAADEGRAERLDAVVAELAKDPARAEVAFVLAAAVAFADDTIADEEDDTLDRMAEGLGIDESRADELLAAVEKDLAPPADG
jgi:uncharacterized tellurite resistance protein B-like protein